MHTDRILRRDEVERRTGIGRSQIYAGMTAGTFPQCVRLTLKSVGWRETEVQAWINSRPTVERGTKQAA